jgi:hypothetical protein
MKIRSIWKIEFLPANGPAVTLLDAGDLVDAEPTFGVDTESERWSPIGNRWGRNTALGGGQRPIAFSRQRTHASPAAARGYAISRAPLVPMAESGKLKITITGGDIWLIDDAVLLDLSVSLVPKIPHATMERISARGAATRPGAAITLFAGIPVSWIYQEPEDITALPSSL